MSEKNKGGRPKKYTDEVIKKHGEGLLKFMQVKKNYWLKDYCIKNDFPSEYLSIWERENSEFSQSLKKAKDIQESKFVEKGINAKGNVAFIIFALKNVSKWRNEDQTDNEIIPQKITIKLPPEFAIRN